MGWRTAFCLAVIVGLCAADGDTVGAPTLQTLPAFGFSIAVPAGFTVDETEPREWTVAEWTREGTGPARQNHRSRLWVMLGSVGARSAQQWAAARVQEAGGRVDPKATTLGGDPATHIILLLKPDRRVRIESILCVHGGYCYELSASTEPGDQPGATLEAARAGWKWMPVERPFKNLAQVRKAVAFADGSAMLDYPAVMRPYPMDRPSATSWDAVSHVANQGLEFTFFAQVTHLASAATDSAELRERIGAGFAKDNQWTHPPVWTSEPGQRDLWQTQWEPITRPAHDKTPAWREWEQFVFVNLGGGLIASIDFEIMESAGPEARKAYEAAAGAIRKSVRPTVVGDFAHYTSPDRSVTVAYPRGWNLETFLPTDTDMVDFTENRTPPTGRYAATMQVRWPQQQPPESPLSDTVDFFIMANGDAEGFHLLTSGAARVGGKHGWRVVFEVHFKNEPPQTVVAYFLLADGKLYRMKFYVGSEQYGWMKRWLDRCADALKVGQ